MELEQRVKALEYEMKILKNEIQRTLLDIQEQVLVHYYPALRTEDTVVPQAIAQAVEKVRTQEPVSIPAQAPAPVPAPAVPIVKTVSLDEARALARGAAPATNVPMPVTDEASRTRKLLQWALNGAMIMGSEKLEAFTKVCAQLGVITPDVQELLARIAPLNRRASPEPVMAGDILRSVLELDLILGRAQDVEEALNLIEEAKIG